MTLFLKILEAILSFFLKAIRFRCSCSINERKSSERESKDEEPKRHHHKRTTVVETDTHTTTINESFSSPDLAKTNEVK